MTTSFVWDTPVRASILPRRTLRHRRLTGQSAVEIAVLSEHPTHYYRLNEASGNAINKGSVGLNGAYSGAGLTRGARDLLNGEDDPGITLDGAAGDVAFAAPFTDGGGNTAAATYIWVGQWIKQAVYAPFYKNGAADGVSLFAIDISGVLAVIAFGVNLWSTGFDLTPYSGHRIMLAHTVNIFGQHYVYLGDIDRATWMGPIAGPNVLGYQAATTKAFIGRNDQGAEAGWVKGAAKEFVVCNRPLGEPALEAIFQSVCGVPYVRDS